MTLRRRIIVPADQLSPQALQGVIDDYIVREGTDYGHRDVSMEEKRRAVRAALTGGEACVTYDPHTRTTTLVLREHLADGATGVG